MKQLLAYFLILTLGFACTPLGSPRAMGPRKSLDPGMPQGPGCYAKCLVTEQGQKITNSHIEYTGTDYENPNVEFVRNEIKPTTQNWVKKKADKNCLSADPEDCMVWCLVTEEAVYEEFYTVLDTNVIKDFEIKNIETQTVTHSYFDWHPVVCEAEITETFVADLTQALNQQGYDLKVKKRMTSALKTTLKQFQEEYDLPVGQLDHTTLNALGVSYKEF